MSMESPYEPDSSSKVSVIIPLYNRIQLIEESIQSIQAQTYTNFETIIVDDGSTDGSYELVQRLAEQDRRVKVLKRSCKPKGASTCRNIGIENAAGKYIIFLDSDDLLAPFCLERRVAKMRQLSQLDFAVFNMLLFHKKPGDLNIIWNIATEENDLERFLRIDGVWSITGPIYKKEFLLKIGGFTEELPFWQDFELHTRALCYDISYAKFFEQAPDSFNRRHDFDSISQKGLHTEEKIIQKFTIYQKIVDNVEIQNKLNNKCRKAVLSVLLNFSRLFIIQHNNLSEAISTWSYAYEKKLINKMYFLIGKLHLKCLYQHKQQNKPVSSAFIFAKFFSLLLKRFQRKENTMCKIESEHAYS